MAAQAEYDDEEPLAAARREFDRVQEERTAPVPEPVQLEPTAFARSVVQVSTTLTV